VIVVDASALVAILAYEPEREAFVAHLLANPAVLSPIGYWEAAIAARRVLGETGEDDLRSLLETLGVTIAPATEATAAEAVRAERDFGKRTPARLNMGDCFAYALARELDAPLLYKGADFNQTDVKAALTA
jgi:ribonuclease VapC